MSKEMSFEEYKKAVFNKCQEDSIVKRYPNEFEKTFSEEIERLYKNNSSVEGAAYDICLMV